MENRTKIAALLVGLVVVVVGYWIFRTMTAPPFPAISPERAQQARERIKQAEKSGPPGGAPGMRR